MIPPKDATQTKCVNRAAAEAAKETREYMWATVTLDTGHADSINDIDYGIRCDSDIILHDNLADAIADADNRTTGILCEVDFVGWIYTHIWVEVYKVYYNEIIDDYEHDWDAPDAEPVYVIGR